MRSSRGIQTWAASRASSKIETVLIGGSTTVGMRGLRIAHVLGYREMHLFGYDSSYSDVGAHAYPQAENDADTLRECVVAGHTFVSTAWMIRQADDFRLIGTSLVCEGVRLHVHGYGLLPTIAQEMGREVKPLTVYYDLSRCPPGFDVLTTLAVAEGLRIERGLDHLKVVFIPGPDDGFRPEEKPHDGAQRRQMFWGIAMGLCRCLPSVKAIEVLNSYGDLVVDPEAAIYPPDYSAENRVGHYGISYLIAAMQRNPDLACFEAPAWLRRQVRKHAAPDTITFTLREASYAEGRNSDLKEWINAADVLRDHGYKIVFVRDTEAAFGVDFHGHEVCHAASYDLAYRLALYESAAVNCVSANGPFTLALMAKHVKAIVFGMEREGEHCMTAAHWRLRGVPVGSEFPGVGLRFKTVWQKETAETIVAETMALLDRNPQGFAATYDLAICPASFDFIPWLISAEMMRRRLGARGPLRVFFAPGPKDGFRKDGLPTVDRQRFLDRVLRPSLQLFNAVESIRADDVQYQEKVYTIRPIVEAVQGGETMPLLSAPADYVARATHWLVMNDVCDPIVIVLREASHWPDRNSKIGNWERLAGVLRADGHDVVFVRDTEKADEKLASGFPTCPEASHDILFQLALYERAKCVLATSAPGFIALFTKAPCLIFPVIDMPDYSPSTDAWWRAHHGIGHGEQFPWSRPDQRIIWDGDSYPVLKQAWDEFEQGKTE